MSGSLSVDETPPTFAVEGMMRSGELVDAPGRTRIRTDRVMYDA